MKHVNSSNGKRVRPRTRRPGSGAEHNYESHGPDVKIRGTASHVAKKYQQLARDALLASDPVSCENYFQHAEHYLRVATSHGVVGDNGTPGDYELDVNAPEAIAASQANGRAVGSAAEDGDQADAHDGGQNAPRRSGARSGRNEDGKDGARPKHRRLRGLRGHMQRRPRGAGNSQEAEAQAGETAGAAPAEMSGEAAKPARSPASDGAAAVSSPAPEKLN